MPSQLDSLFKSHTCDQEAEELYICYHCGEDVCFVCQNAIDELVTCLACYDRIIALAALLQELYATAAM